MLICIKQVKVKYLSTGSEISSKQTHDRFLLCHSCFVLKKCGKESINALSLLIGVLVILETSLYIPARLLSQLTKVSDLFLWSC